MASEVWCQVTSSRRLKLMMQRLQCNYCMTAASQLHLTAAVAQAVVLQVKAARTLANSKVLSLPAELPEGQLCRYCFYSWADFLVFALQGWHDAPIKVKFGREERTVVTAKFHLYLFRDVGLRPLNYHYYSGWSDLQWFIMVACSSVPRAWRPLYFTDVFFSLLPTGLPFGPRAKGQLCRICFYSEIYRVYVHPYDTW